MELGGACPKFGCGAWVAEVTRGKAVEGRRNGGGSLLTSCALAPAWLQHQERAVEIWEMQADGGAEGGGR